MSARLRSGSLKMSQVHLWRTSWFQWTSRLMIIYFKPIISKAKYRHNNISIEFLKHVFLSYITKTYTNNNFSFVLYWKITIDNVGTICMYLYQTKPIHSTLQWLAHRFDCNPSNEHLKLSQRIAYIAMQLIAIGHPARELTSDRSG